MLVEDAMVDHGGLAEISLDGYMAVQIETDKVSEGDDVTVVLSDGEEEEGTVKSVIGKTATILVTDNGPEYDEEVAVKDEAGTELGSGKLYIHNPLKVTGYAGTIKTVNTSLNQQVYTGTTLFTLTNTSSMASYDKKEGPSQPKEADSGPFYYDFDAGFTNHFAKGKCCKQLELWRQRVFCPYCPHCPACWSIPP